MQQRYCLTILLILLAVTGGYAQKNPDKLSPKAYYNLNDYNRALEGYLELWPTHQRDLEINLNIATCYLHVNGDKSKAIPYLSYLVREGNKDEEVIFMLGQAYMYADNFEEALKYFNSYRARTGPKNYDIADLYITYCNNAREMEAHPQNVVFENLGKEVNTKYPDYYPFVVEHDSTMYYTARRETNTGNMSSFEGFYTSDIYVAHGLNGQFTRSKNLGVFINTAEDEQCVYVTPDGKNMIIYVDNTKLKISDDLFITSAEKGKAFPKPSGFDNPVNTDFGEMEGCISRDLSTMFIASDRPGGMGETDIYMIEKEGPGKWGKPVDLGPAINSRYSEAFPVYDEATHTLYFASNGPKSMGGFDVFRSVYDPKTKAFGPAINLGYPINTTDDNMVFSLAANKHDGYLSAYRPEGYGDLDIYRVSYRTTLKGTVTAADSAAALNATVSILHRNGTLLQSREIRDADNQFAFILAPGKYILTVKAAGYPELLEDIVIDEKDNYAAERKKDIVLKHPPGAAPKTGPKSPKKKPVKK